MRFTDLFIARPVLAIAINLLLLIAGIAAFSALQVRQFPKMEFTVVTVTTVYTGASADLVQGFVTQPLQEQIAAADGVDYLTSESRSGTSVITVRVASRVDLPLLPDVLGDGSPSFALDAEHTVPIGQYLEVDDAGP